MHTTSELVLDDETFYLLIIIPADRNECTETLCHVNASCINTVGSFYCDCNAGFLGNGIDCEGKHIPSLYIIGQGKLLSTTDVDECTVNNGGCEDGCENAIGSFFCTCPSYGQGFKADGTECVGRYHCLL